MENKNIHSQLKTAMQEAWEHVDLDKETVEQFEIPEPDLSFLEDLESKNKKPEKHHRLAKIAVFLKCQTFLFRKRTCRGREWRTVTGSDRLGGPFRWKRDRRNTVCAFVYPRGI